LHTLNRETRIEFGLDGDEVIPDYRAVLSDILLSMILTDCRARCLVRSWKLCSFSALFV